MSGENSCVTVGKIFEFALTVSLSSEDTAVCSESAANVVTLNTDVTETTISTDNRALKNLVSFFIDRPPCYLVLSGLRQSVMRKLLYY